MSLPFIKLPSGNLQVVVGSRSFHVAKDHINYDVLVEALKEEDEKKFLRNYDIPKQIAKASKGLVDVSGGEVTYQGKPVHNLVATRILDFMREGLPFQPLVNFLEKLQLNPSKTAVDELFYFLEVSGMVICEDGDFLGYKSVLRSASGDLYDHHTKTILNNPGTVNEMPRNKVSDRRDIACHHGFHIGSKNYSHSFGGVDSAILMVKVNPRDVCSVPADYNNEKLRSCRYEVVKEIPRDTDFQPLYTSAGDTYDGPVNAYDPSDDWYDVSVEEEVYDNDVDYEENEETWYSLEDLDDSWHAGYEAAKNEMSGIIKKGSNIFNLPKRDSLGRFTS